jgi:hypothetical protein
VPAEGIDSVVLTELLDTFGREEVRVEEQDHAYYIIHLDMESRLGGNPNPEEWIVVRSDSPLFGLLRERHQREQKQTKTGSGHAE